MVDRVRVARDTVEIAEKRFYMLEGKRVSIVGATGEYVDYKEGCLPNITKKSKGNIHVEPYTTGKAISICGSRKTVALNFASPVRPGGSFLEGGMAQEEALCYCSDLSVSLNRFKNSYYKEAYKFPKGMGQNSMILSHNVTFFKNDNFEHTQPVVCDIITQAALNRGLMNVSDMEAYNIMYKKIQAIIATLANKRYDCVILGAYGCGVFGNNPLDVARIFKDLLVNKEYRYMANDIIFAIPIGRDNNFHAFKKVFEGVQ